VSCQLHAPAALSSGKGPQAFIKYAGSVSETRGCSEKFTNDTLYRLYATCVGLTAAEPRGVHGLQWTPFGSCYHVFWSITVSKDVTSNSMTFVVGSSKVEHLEGTGQRMGGSPRGFVSSVVTASCLLMSGLAELLSASLHEASSCIEMAEHRSEPRRVVTSVTFYIGTDGLTTLSL
jgi:hypothetical protein